MMVQPWVYYFSGISETNNQWFFYYIQKHHGLPHRLTGSRCINKTIDLASEISEFISHGITTELAIAQQSSTTHA